MRKRSWRDLNTGQKVGVIVLGAVELALFAAAQLDIRRRPANEIRGPKALWMALAFINVLGPLAYFAVGRKD